MFTEPLEGRYAIRRKLAAGGHGRVFLAEDLKLGRAVAVKVLSATSPSTEREAVQRIEREGRVLAAIHHPNVCAVTDIGRLPSGLPFLVLELLEGETLATRVASGRLALETALELAKQILLGLAATHRLGVVHRDVKPSNIFLVDLGHERDLVKLLDFGTALVPGGPPSDGATLTRTGGVVGTVDYMAPEQVRGLRTFDARTDVYAAGVVVYEMLAGHRPFGDLPLDALCEAIAFRQPPPLASVAPQIPRPIARAVDLALSVDLARRHGDAMRFLDALFSPTLAIDDWDLLTDRAAAAGEVGLDLNEWELVTHRLAPPGASPKTDASSGAIGIEVSFATDERRVVSERELTEDEREEAHRRR
jgi:serine/threonine protein kinase